MAPSAVSRYQTAWYKWKALHLPWRKRFLIGLDLQGNTFWEFKDTLSSDSHRMRRIVQYPRSTQYSEVKISPQWHQWLRHTRRDPPSLTEQSEDLVRQENLKVLAAQADARWAAKSSVLEAPEKEDGRKLVAAESRDLGDRDAGRSAATEGLGNEHLSHERSPQRKQVDEQKEDPWKQARGGPSEGWQPEAWNGNIAAKR